MQTQRFEGCPLFDRGDHILRHRIRAGRRSRSPRSLVDRRQVPSRQRGTQPAFDPFLLCHLARKPRREVGAVLYLDRSHRPGENGEIHIRDVATGMEKVLARHITTEDAHRVACQQWISGGRRVAYHDVRDGHWVVAVVDVATGEVGCVLASATIRSGSPPRP